MAPAPHFLVVTYPAYGHINPALHFARRLARTGVRVTFTSTLFAHRRMIKPITPDLISYAAFSDGNEDRFDFVTDIEKYLPHLSDFGPRALSDLVRNLAHPVTYVVYTINVPWAADVARDVGIPSSLLWIQPATVFVIYYLYFHGYETVFNDKNKQPSSTIELPGMPPLTYEELPPFILPSNTCPNILTILKQLFQKLDREEKPQVLVNTFDALESYVLRAVDAVQMAGVGPLIPFDFLDEKASIEKSKDYYVEWLDSKARSSVVYVSFGTLWELSKRQIEEISKGLSESGRPFLWVVRESKKESDTETRNGVDVSGDGLVVSWCSQVEVLSHRSVGCFVTHCGWNSTTEGLATGVPMVCFPQWSDQLMNAKLVEKVWKTGVRVKVKADEDGVMESGELKRCLEEVMGGEEMRKNADKWREGSREAVGEGGSSDQNMKAFGEEIIQSKAVGFVNFSPSPKISFLKERDPSLDAYYKAEECSPNI